MSTHHYEATAFGNAADLASIQRRALRAGYTGVNVTMPNPAVDVQQPICVEVAESIDKTALRDDIQAAGDPSLQIDAAHTDVPSDMVTSVDVTISDSRGAVAAGKTVNLIAINGVLVASPGSQTLDANGDAVFTLGPSWATNVRSGPMTLEFALADESAKPVRATMRFTG